ncbi:Serine/threonine-protein kinase GIN4 [Choanephora cucurbitarum]|uniref:non-specific serine/threonine protein kinase n=1 Tax=Choanephora cucurbitarum TaxID=101091 RepID=A0A1C7NGY3_9FUNG|nr:Serine/threonine-protein kinase GIN4 [Choanephora cucurbitarum]
MPEQSQTYRPNSRRPSASAASTRSSKSMRDRRRSSGAVSTHSQHKPKKYIGDYIVGKTLGKGASGRVKLGVHKHTGEQVAIKIISKTHLAANPAIEKAVRREIAIMKLIHHPNVMSLIDVIDDDSSPDLYLILEYVQGGELFEYLVSKGRLSESEARHHFQQIILGLDYCHHHLICHRDLKPENLLLNSKNNIKIADFGMASLQPIGSLLETSCGSPHYASPEIVAGMPYQGSACDIWSCGVILYALLTGHLPFDDENIRQLLKKVRSGRYVMPDNISRSAQDLIQRILVVDPSKRLNMQQIMLHPWFREVEPFNLHTLPIPPTKREIGQPVAVVSEIDNRLLETIKFLWGEAEDQTVVDALMQKEHNMQKVVYVLLQRHANRHWQAEHNDESDDDGNCTDNPQRQYHTLGRKSVRSKKHLSTAGSPVSKTVSSTMPSSRRPVNPWMPEAKPALSKRQSTATLRSEKALIDLPCSSPPLPSLALKPDKMKKSETFYAKFVKTVLSPSRKQYYPPQELVYRPNRHAEETPSREEPQMSPIPNSKPTSSTWVGTLRRKNPFQKSNAGTNKFDITIDSSNNQNSKSGTHRMSNANILQRNKIDPTSIEEPTNPRKSATLNAKKFSLRIANTFKTDEDTKKFGFTFNNTKKQRKQLDLSIFQSKHDSSLQPPPALLSDKSTLNSSSSISSSTQSSYSQSPQKSSTKTSSNMSSNLKPQKFITFLKSFTLQ